MTYSDEFILHIAHAWFLASREEPVTAENQAEEWEKNRPAAMRQTRKFLRVLERKHIQLVQDSEDA